jgi:uncharacterized iron-regulated membrane protein
MAVIAVAFPLVGISLAGVWLFDRIVFSRFAKTSTAA